MKRFRKICAALFLATPLLSLHAQEQAATPVPQSYDNAAVPDNGEQKEQQLDNVVVVGTRTAPRTVTTTPLPVDNFSAKDLGTTGQLRLDQAMQYRVPSFNSVNTPVNDATTLLDPWEIRNLGPSRTLVLINGKRKNLSSLLYVQFSPGRGEVGVDMSAIPSDAIKSLEILRDGASAQYGSDAIAGVVNIVLKDRYEYSSLTANYGVTHKGDGNNYSLSFNSGSNFGKKGFVNYTAQVQQTDDAVRSGKVSAEGEVATFGWGSYKKLSDFQKLESDAVDYFGKLINPKGANATQADLDNWNNVELAKTNNALKKDRIVPFLAKKPDAGNINGTGATTASRFLINLGLPVGEHAQLYANGAFVSKRVKSHANYRTPYWKLDYGLLHERNDNLPNYTASSTPDNLYNGYVGYVPTFEGDLMDYNGSVGVKNDINGWKTDASITVGGNEQRYTVNNTVNHTLQAAGPISYKTGGYAFSNVIANIDVTKALTNNFSLALGSEARTEKYEIIAGDSASYSGQGANSFPGINAVNAKIYSRANVGFYVDASWDVFKNLLVNGTARYENYSDFGDAMVYKVSSRLKTNDDKIVLRGSYSTGFRAPALHQIYQQSTQASFQGGVIQTTGLFNNSSSIARQLGIPKLKAEKSENVTVGLGFNPVKNLSITLDYYYIDITDRIVYSSTLKETDITKPLGQILKNNNIVGMSFFINGIETRTQGLDFVLSYKNLQLGGTKKLNVNFAGNYVLENKIVGNVATPSKLNGYNLLSTQISSLLTESRPNFKMVLGLDFLLGKLNVNLNNTFIGRTRFQDLDNGGSDMENIRQEFSPNVLTDLNFGYTVNKNITASFTISNIFNVLPSWKLKALNAAGQKVLDNADDKSLLEDFLTFNQRYDILGYNGAQFSQLGTTFMFTINYKF